jgi:hypothetical protein
MPEDTEETWPNLCGGIQEPYLFAGEPESARSALQTFWNENYREPSWSERQQILQKFQQ